MKYRSSYRRCSAKKVFLEVQQNSQENRCFPVSSAKFFRTPFLQNTSGRLLLKVVTGKSLFLVIGPFMHSLFYLSWHCLLIWQFFMEMLRFRFYYFQLKNDIPVFFEKASFSKVNIENGQSSTGFYIKTCRRYVCDMNMW